MRPCQVGLSTNIFFRPSCLYFVIVIHYRERRNVNLPRSALSFLGKRSLVYIIFENDNKYSRFVRKVKNIPGN